MLKIFGRLLGLKEEELKYNRELLLFVLVGGIIFIFLGFNHTENGAKFLYANKLNQILLVKVEKKGISKEQIHKINSEFKEIVPINIIEYDIRDIKDNLKNYINNIKAQDQMYLTDLALKLQVINKINDKNALVKEVKMINIENMLKGYSKEEIVKRNLLEVAQCQTNIFLSNIYFICGGIIGLYFIIIKVVCEISILGKREKKGNRIA